MKSAFLAVLLLFSCTGQKHREGGLLFKDWFVVRPVVAGGGSVAYGSIKNESGTVQLLKKAEFSCAGVTELHETITTGDRVRMDSLSTVPIEPGAVVHFEPGHKHVMLPKLTLPADGKCSAIFTFESAAVRFLIPVRERTK